MSEFSGEFDLAYDKINNFIKSGRFPHAFLIEGASNSEKTALAKIIAQISVCNGEPVPCKTCVDCRQAENNTHPDISFISEEKGKKNITVNQIREVKAQAYVLPHSGKRRVFIIENADKMNEQAQNAILKILEEPPKTVVFVLLCSSRTLLLDTVVSRCINLSLSFSDKTSEKTKAEQAAEKFCELYEKDKDYEILCLLQGFVKDRAFADEFFAALKIAAEEKLKSKLSSKVLCRKFAKLYKNISKWQEMLKINVNLSLLFCSILTED